MQYLILNLFWLVASGYQKKEVYVSFSRHCLTKLCGYNYSLKNIPSEFCFKKGIDKIKSQPCIFNERSKQEQHDCRTVILKNWSHINKLCGKYFLYSNNQLYKQHFLDPILHIKQAEIKRKKFMYSFTS